MRQMLLAIFVGAVAFLGGFGCGKTPSAPTPSPVSPPAPSKPAATSRTFTVLSGWDRVPVIGAVVTIGGVVFQSDASGRVTAPADTGAPIDVDVSGFLPRRTTVDRAVSEITLWPVANDAESEAIHAMVYGVYGKLYPPADNPFFLTSAFNIADSAVVSAAWQAEAEAFGQDFGLIYFFSDGFMYEVNEVEVGFDGVSGSWNCSPSAVTGFCRISSPYRQFKVRPDVATRPEVIRRVLASWFLATNPLPGLMNAAQPDDHLSLLEQQTIRMILQRQKVNRWPDTDR